MTWQNLLWAAAGFVVLSFARWALNKVFDRTVMAAGRSLWDKWVAWSLRRNERFKADVARASVDSSFAMSRFTRHLAGMAGWLACAILALVFVTGVFVLHAISDPSTVYASTDALMSGLSETVRNGLIAGYAFLMLSLWMAALRFFSILQLASGVRRGNKDGTVPEAQMPPWSVRDYPADFHTWTEDDRESFKAYLANESASAHIEREERNRYLNRSEPAGAQLTAAERDQIERDKRELL